VHSQYALQKHHLEKLGALFQTPSNPSQSILGGRCAVIRTCLPDIGTVIIKHYTRGGILRHFMRQRYFRLGRLRCQREFSILCRVRSLGINAPEPIAYIFQGRLWYQAWLITREVPSSVTLADLQSDKDQDIKRIMDCLVAQVSLLVQNSILHHDFHPGNVLVGPKNSIYLIDFDKATVSLSGQKRLVAKYARRWQQAVIKHDLSKCLNSCFKTSLEKCRADLNEENE
jgi:3-deoxy-D-manno-octulosonic acid kinase